MKIKNFTENLEYILMRLLRRYIPGFAYNFLRRNRIIIKPGKETSFPADTAIVYKNKINELGFTLKDKSVFILGYGGKFGLAIELLNMGASHIFLCDPTPISRDNLELLPKQYFLETDNGLIPNPERITVIHDTLDNYLDTNGKFKADIVLSSSVLEHISNIEPVVRSLKTITSSEGIHLHFVDLRDHYFRYPFKMLVFSENIWKLLLNPPSNLNRLRSRDYRKHFERFFKNIKIEVIESDVKEFLKAKEKVKPYFKTGDDSADAITKITIIAKN